MPRFSIIVPVYNVEPYLRPCLQSLQEQSFHDWEAVCVDDGSTDHSGELLDRLAQEECRFRTIHQPNRGLSAARNAGLDASHGEYILFLDGDDLLLPQALEKLDQACGLEDMVCFSGQRFFEGTGQREAPDTIDEETGLTGWQYYCLHAFDKRNFAFVSVVLRCYRRSFLQENHLRFHEGLLHEDNEFTPRACLRAQSVMVISDILYNYRIRSNSIMTTRGLQSKESLITIGNELSELFAKETGIDRTIVYRHLTQCYQMAFIDNTRKEDRHLRPLVDWRCYRRVSRTKPRHRLNYATIRIATPLFRLINRIC